MPEGLALAAQHLHHLVSASPGGHLPHHLLHLFELVEELVYLSGGGAAAAGDAPASAATDYLGPLSLLGRHRVDDCLDALEVVAV